MILRIFRLKLRTRNPQDTASGIRTTRMASERKIATKRRRKKNRLFHSTKKIRCDSRSVLSSYALIVNIVVFNKGRDHPSGSCKRRTGVFSRVSPDDRTRPAVPIPKRIKYRQRRGDSLATASLDSAHWAH